MANPQDLQRLQGGPKDWNEWRRQNRNAMPDLRCADLREASLLGADLSRSDLRGANLREADLRRADLTRASLDKADLSLGDLSGANLREAILGNGNFSGAYFYGTNLSNAFVNKVNLSGASFWDTVFGNINLSSAIGLETCKHFGPSIVDYHTLENSGVLPTVFLRGCGLPDHLIDYLPTLRSESPVQFYTCFISHSSTDKQFCARLYNDLQGAGVRCWYFPEDAKWGRGVWSEIDQAIRKYDKLIVVCSKNSLTSGPVLREIERSLNREDTEANDILFPITVDSFVFDEWKRVKSHSQLKLIGLRGLLKLS